MKLSEKELEQINGRKSALKSLSVIAQMAQREYELYIKELIVKKGLDPKRTYKILDDGRLMEIKEEEVSGAELEVNKEVEVASEESRKCEAETNEQR